MVLVMFITESESYGACNVSLNDMLFISYPFSQVYI